MDFQASDILGALFGACTPGDIRVHYTALFIDVASMMGAVHPSKDLLTTQTVSIKGGGNSRESYRVGVVHKGALSAPEMLKKELAEGRCGQRMFFCLLFVPAKLLRRLNPLQTNQMASSCPPLRLGRFIVPSYSWRRRNSSWLRCCCRHHGWLLDALLGRAPAVPHPPWTPVCDISCFCSKQQQAERRMRARAANQQLYNSFRCVLLLRHEVAV